MDRMLWVATGGADQMLQAQTVVTHNLANATTPGFRADLHAFSSYLIQGPGFPTRVSVVDEQLGFDPRYGALQETGSPLDLAIRGDGWFAVQAADGTEAYTRAGSLRVNADGLLETAAGRLVLGDGGPLSLPPATTVEVGADGTVSVVPLGLGPETMAAVGRIKLVNPPVTELVKGADGLMRLRDGSNAAADAAVRIVGGTLESSNVRAADALVEMIQISRQYELQVRLMETARDNDQTAQQLLRAA
ncbi:MAG: flagellar basal body rod protein FlgF [Gammaproteobacteria bacterium]|jgi:flagellar basal-body rod protein FlgF|nr:MAG: flagellar basal body rod protein FlgF [Gammaproteobacteria bacterium]